MSQFKEVFDHDICTECGGKCCSGSPCNAHPSDFGDTHEEIFANLVEALSSGMWIVDFWDGGCPGLPEDAEGYFVKPRSINDDRNSLFYPSWGGPCIFLQEDGCPFPDDIRPMGARTLEPRGDIRACIQHAEYKNGNDKPTFAKAWFPYEDELNNLRRSCRTFRALRERLTLRSNNGTHHS